MSWVGFVKSGEIPVFRGNGACGVSDHEEGFAVARVGWWANPSPFRHRDCGSLRFRAPRFGVIPRSPRDLFREGEGFVVDDDVIRG